MLPSPNQLRNKIIIKHKASMEPSQQRSKSLAFSSYPSPPNEDSIEEDDKYFEYSQDAKVGKAKHPEH